MEEKVRFCLVFEREILSVPVMRQVLGDTLRGIGVNDDSVDDILLAATEACTNVVLHAGPTAPYTVATTVDKAGCRVEVTDSGSGLPGEHPASPGESPRTPRPVPPEGLPDAEPASYRAGRRGRRREQALAESGRGFEIMRACVDTVTLRSAPGEGTHVVLDKRISWEDRELAAAGSGNTGR